MMCYQKADSLAIVYLIAQVWKIKKETGMRTREKRYGMATIGEEEIAVILDRG